MPYGGDPKWTVVWELFLAKITVGYNLGWPEMWGEARIGHDQLALFCWFLAAQESHKLILEAETGWVHRLRYSGNRLCTVGKWRDSPFTVLCQRVM